jgi:excinuclease ABC subunit C
MEKDYNENIEQIRDILKGNITGVNKYLRDLMKKLAEEYKFENKQLRSKRKWRYWKSSGANRL